MRSAKSGFTLVELMVVVVIVSLLTAVASFSFATVRADARDTKRVSDIEQIGLALRLYAQEYGGYPDCPSGTVLEPGRSAIGSSTNCPDEVQLKQYLVTYFGALPADPRGLDDPDYYYYYDSARTCFSGGDSAALVFAVNLETRPGNADETCVVSGGNHGGFEQTPDVDPSQPYAYLLDRN